MTQRHRREFLRLLGTGAAFGAANETAGAAASGGRTTSGPPLPGPSILHDDPVTAPQFETTGIWRADSLRVSGTDAYVDGEYLYQGWAYDDYGAATTAAPTPPESDPDSNTFGGMSGDIVYPTDEDAYANNVADLLELRAQPRGDSVVYRITTTTMTDPELVGVAVGIDTRGGDRTDWGYGLGDLGAPVNHVVFVNGDNAELDGISIPARVDPERNQIEVEVPLSPGDETWRHYCVTGLFDREAEQFKQIRDQPDETHPGGANGQNPPPVFDVGFRFDRQEPMGATNTSFVDPTAGQAEPSGAEQELDESTE